MVRGVTQSETRSVESLLAAGGAVDHLELFAELWATIAGLRGAIDARFSLQAVPEVEALAKYGNEACRGELRAFRGPGMARLVQAWLGAPERGFMNLHLNAWLGPETTAPHLAVVLATVPDLFIYLDCPARVDVASEPEYVERYYGEGNARLLELSADPLFVPYVSRSPYMRAVQSPGAMCFVVRGEGAAARMRALAREQVERWLRMVETAEAVPEDRRAALAERDLKLRRSIVERDPANGVAERLLGPALTRRLVAGLWGGGED